MAEITFEERVSAEIARTNLGRSTTTPNDIESGRRGEVRAQNRKTLVDFVNFMLDNAVLPDMVTRVETPPTSSADILKLVILRLACKRGLKPTIEPIGWTLTSRREPDVTGLREIHSGIFTTESGNLYDFTTYHGKYLNQYRITDCRDFRPHLLDRVTSSLSGVTDVDKLHGDSGLNPWYQDPDYFRTMCVSAAVGHLARDTVVTEM